jgi:hypothetical protein
VAGNDKNAAQLATHNSPLATSLWAALVDGQPIEVRRADGAFLIPLRPSDDPAAERSLQLFYRTNVPALRGTGELRQPPPELTVLNGAGVSQPMQLLDQQWELRYPPELLLTDSQGAFVPDSNTPLDRTDWLSNLPKSLSLPRMANLNRMMAAIVCVLIGVGFVWSRYRYGWRRGVVTPGVLLGLGLFFWFVAAPGVQSARNAARRTELSRDVSGGAPLWLEPSESIADAGKFVISDAPAAGGMSAPVTAPAMPPMAAEPNAPAKPGAEAMPKPQDKKSKKEPSKKMAMEAELKSLADMKGDQAKSSANGKTKFVPRVGAFAVEFDEVPMDHPAKGYTAEEALKLKAGKEASGAKSRTRPLSPLIAKMPQPGENTVNAADDVQELELVIRQTQSVAGEGERGGLLSLTMAMEAQDGATTKKFRYLGTETAGNGIGLDLVYENRAAGWTGRGVWIAALAFLAWLLPPNRRAFKGTWAALGLTLPLALAAIAPLAWQNTLDGIFFGTVAAIALWIIRAAGEGLASAWPRMKTKAFWTRSLTKRAAS